MEPNKKARASRHMVNENMLPHRTNENTKMTGRKHSTNSNKVLMGNANKRRSPQENVDLIGDIMSNMNHLHNTMKPKNDKDAPNSNQSYTSKVSAKVPKVPLAQISHEPVAHVRVGCNQQPPNKRSRCDEIPSQDLKAYDRNAQFGSTENNYYMKYSVEQKAMKMEGALLSYNPPTAPYQSSNSYEARSRSLLKRRFFQLFPDFDWKLVKFHENASMLEPLVKRPRIEEHSTSYLRERFFDINPHCRDDPLFAPPKDHHKKNANPTSSGSH